MNPVAQTPMVDPELWPILSQDLPILYEDEEDPEMGEANRHYLANEILHACLQAFLQLHSPELKVFANMNCYYLPGPPHPTTGSLPYFSADCMIVRPFEPLPVDLVSYTIGEQGPAPLVTIEVLSKRSAQQGDLKQKIILYARLGVEQYILLKRLQADGTWRDERGPDGGGVSSKLGFRLGLDPLGEVAVIDTTNQRHLVRPHEAESEAAARRQAEERVRVLEAELARLRQAQNRDEV